MVGKPVAPTGDNNERTEPWMKGSTIDCGFNLLGYARIYCLTPFLLLTWLTVLSRLRHWRTAQLRSFDRLAHGKEELRNAHSLLEMRMQERTSELRKASLEVQASEARTAAQLLETNCRLEAATARANELAVRAESANGAKSEFLASMSHEVRDDQNYWQQVESYISKRTDARFSHGYCPDCFKKAMQEIEASAATAA
jgi:signal transduction histidine kinase